MFLRYVLARYNQSQRDWAYRFYISKQLRIIGENTAQLCVANHLDGKFMAKDLLDYLEPKQAEQKSGDEIVADVLNKLGLEVKNEPI